MPISSIPLIFYLIVYCRINEEYTKTPKMRDICFICHEMMKHFKRIRKGKDFPRLDSKSHFLSVKIYCSNFSLFKVTRLKVEICVQNGVHFYEKRFEIQTCRSEFV